MVAGTSVFTYRFSVFSIQDGKDFKYYENAKLNGWAYDFLEVGPDEFCLFTYQVGNEGEPTYYWFDVYYINTADVTVRRVLKQIGAFGKSNYRAEISTDSIVLNFKKEKLEFSLFEYKVKKEGEKYAPNDTLISTYSWDNRAKNFVKK